MDKTPEQNTIAEIKSPRWSNNTKLVVALTFVAILAGVLVKFRNFIGPLLLAFILSYLVYPLIEKLHRRLKIPWRVAVLLIYLLGLVILIGLMVWGGIALLEQIQSLIRFLQTAISNLPSYINQLSRQVITIGPFELDFRTLDLRDWTNQLIGMIQPMFSRLGSLVGGLATSAASVVGWALFILLVSFFIVSETQGNAGRLIDIQIPGYSQDTKRLGVELSRIWNAFLRNQLILIALTVIVYTLVLGILRVRFFFGLAILAGLARFVPYVGPTVAWTTYGLVSYFQGYTIFGLSPIWYVVLVIGISVVIDSTIDNVVTPTLMADALKVHPAAVMVAVLMAASLLGVIGVLLAAPVLASAKLIGDYAFSKMFDLDPWRKFSSEQNAKKEASDLSQWRKRLANWLAKFRRGQKGNDAQ
ncbi:MAG: AI-2E family transporter [Anaerolineae bacterium]|nr:AI-2E family transporter [Anaerolineae bacterium]